MEEERDFVVFTDDDGNDFELDVIDYFEHDGAEYAILTELPDDEADEEQELEVYIMKVEANEEEDYEEFLPPDDALMDVLTEIAEKRLAEMDDHCCCGECGDDCDCHK
ncbi:MAG: DUF1292 domain-containing protein [Clostridia bacterium]|nr:DUF1292 domain-containing protein [Clostridia bacterium]